MNSGFPDHPNLPVRESDTDDVRWALQTAIVQLRRGGVADAIVWVQRAADEAEASGASWRAQELRAQADYLAAHVWQATSAQAPVPSSEIPVELDVIEDVEELEEDDLLEETGALPSQASMRTAAPRTLISSVPPLGTAHAPGQPSPAPSPSAPPAPKHAQTLLATVPPLPQSEPPSSGATPPPRWRQTQPGAGASPFQAQDLSPTNLAEAAPFRRPQASAPDLEIEEVSLEDVAMEDEGWRTAHRAVGPQEGSSNGAHTGHLAGAALAATELPLDEVGEAAPELDDLFDEEEVIEEDDLDRLSELTLDPAEFGPEPTEVPRAAKTGFERQPSEPAPASTDGVLAAGDQRTSSRVTVQPHSHQSGPPSSDDDERLFDASTIPPPRGAAVHSKPSTLGPPSAALAPSAPAPTSAAPSRETPEPTWNAPSSTPAVAPASVAPPAPIAAPVPPFDGTEVDGIDLQVTRGFEDLPEEVQQQLAAQARVEALNQGEEVGFFGAALVTHGSVDIVPAISEDPGALAHQGDVVFTKGTLRDGVALRVVAKMDDTRVATWSPETLEGALADCPWVHDELRLIADYYLAVCGAALGPLGERLDDALRATVFQRLEVRAYRPGDVLAEPGKAVPGLFVLGGGRVELVNDRGKVERELALGDFLFPSSILSATPVEVTARAGQGGALMLFAPRAVAHELMMSVPPLLEVLAS